MSEQKQPERESAISLLKIHVEWLKETSRNQLFDAHAIGEMIKEAESRSRPITPAPENPCVENGCTDIENCDEICEHSRIYSPAWVKQHDLALIQRTREEVLKEIVQLKNNAMEVSAAATTKNEETYHDGQAYAYERIAKLLRQPPTTGSTTTSPAQCIWSEDENGVYDTGCGNKYEITNGTPKENRMRYCPFCGKAIGTSPAKGKGGE